MSYKNKYRSYIVDFLDEAYPEIENFYENEYKSLLGRSTSMSLEISEYTKNEDGLFVLENINGDDSMHFENVINLTSLETYTGNAFEVSPYVVDFCSGRTLIVKKPILLFSKDTSMKILDIDFNLLNKFVNRIDIPERCFDLTGIPLKENVLDLSHLSYVDFTDFLAGDIDFSLFGVSGIKNKCIGSKFNTLNLTTVKTFDSTTDPYFTDCNIKYLAISHDTLINSKSTFCLGCNIDELLIYDTRDINSKSDEFQSYINKMIDMNIYCFKTCNIKKLVLVSNLLSSNMFSACTIEDMEISPRDNNNGFEIHEKAISYSTFNCRTQLNVSKLSNGSFYQCVINKDLSKDYKVNFYKPLILYVKDIPDEHSVSDAMSSFVDCYGNFEVLDCTVDTVSENTPLFDNNGEINDDIIYNTLYAMLYRGATHYIVLPKEFR